MLRLDPLLVVKLEIFPTYSTREITRKLGKSEQMAHNSKVREFSPGVLGVVEPASTSVFEVTRPIVLIHCSFWNSISKTNPFLSTFRPLFSLLSTTDGPAYVVKTAFSRGGEDREGDHGDNSKGNLTPKIIQISYKPRTYKVGDCGFSRTGDPNSCQGSFGWMIKHIYIQYIAEDRKETIEKGPPSVCWFAILHGYWLLRLLFSVDIRNTSRTVQLSMLFDASRPLKSFVGEHANFILRLRVRQLTTY